MREYMYVTLRQKPELKKEAAAWFHENGKYRRKLILNVWNPISIMKQNMVGTFA